MSALRLNADVAIRFSPAANYNGPAPALIVHLIDDSISFVNGSTKNLVTNGTGGNTPYSTDTISIGETVNAVNDAPVLAPNTGAISYYKNAPATAIKANLALSDVDSATLTGATVSITGNFMAGQDVLGFVDQNGITGSYNAATGILTLSGTASVGDYQAALRSVTYFNSSASPSSALRTVSFQADDGQAANHASNVATSTINVRSAFDVIELSSLNGIYGFRIKGETTNDYHGSTVASAGDINGDGFDDIIVGSAFASPDPSRLYTGASYVIFGTASGFAADFDLGTLNGSNGFQINGELFADFAGFLVGSAGDVNGDGFDDIIVGAYGADPNGHSRAGATYIVFGKDSGFPADLELSTLDGTNGFQINGEAQNDYSGYFATSAGDINADGYDDVIIGARFADPNGLNNAGASYVVYGSGSAFPAVLNLSGLNGTNGFQINGEFEGDRSGIAAASAGDVNGDGLDDLVIGAYYAGPNGRNSGSAYVVFASASGFPANFELSSINGTNGFKVNGEGEFDGAGISVAPAGDVNGDGFADVFIGAYEARPNGVFRAGAGYVVFGKASRLSRRNGALHAQRNQRLSHQRRVRGRPRWQLRRLGRRRQRRRLRRLDNRGSTAPLPASRDGLCGVRHGLGLSGQYSSCLSRRDQRLYHRRRHRGGRRRRVRCFRG